MTFHLAMQLAGSVAGRTHERALIFLVVRHDLVIFLTFLLDFETKKKSGLRSRITGLESAFQEQ